MILTVDWHKTRGWRVFAGGKELGHFQVIHLEVPSRLEMQTENHGVLVCDGQLESDGDQAWLRPK